MYRSLGLLLRVVSLVLSVIGVRARVALFLVRFCHDRGQRTCRSREIGDRKYGKDIDRRAA